MADELLSSELPSFRLDGRLAVVTGASAGIGRAIAEGYAAAGAEVILVSRRAAELAKVEESIQANGGKALSIAADLSVVADIRTMERRVAQLLESRTVSLILVNCAGFGFTKAALDTTEEDWDKLVDLHAKGTFFCCQSLARAMIDRGYGKIINLGSTWSVSTDAGKSIYGAAKAAVSYLTAALSTEWAPLGVRVNAIAPTATATESTMKNLQTETGRAEKLLSRIKLGRLAQPSDLLGTAIFLASPASDFITGQTIFVDGGWNAGR